MTEDVFRCFQAIVEDREKPRFEKMVDGYTGFLFLDKEGLPMVAMHWEHRFNHMVKRYNDIFQSSDAEHNASCLLPYLLQQYGKGRDESKDTPVSDGAQ